MSANPILITPATQATYANITDSFILQSPLMTWSGINGSGVDSLQLFTVTTTNFPKNMTIELEADMQLYDETYYASFNISGPCSLCIPSSGNIFAFCGNIGNNSGNYATDNPAPTTTGPLINIYVLGTQWPVITNPGSVQFGVNTEFQGFSSCTVMGRITLKCSNLNGLDAISFP